MLHVLLDQYGEREHANVRGESVKALAVTPQVSRYCNSSITDLWPGNFGWAHLAGQTVVAPLSIRLL